MTTSKQRTEALISCKDLMRDIVALSPPKPSIYDNADVPEIADVEMMEIPVNLARRLKHVLRNYPFDVQLKQLAEARPDILANPEDATGRY